MSIYFSKGDGIAVFVGRGSKTLHAVEVSGAGDVEHGDADGLELAAAQRPAGKVGSISELAHGGAHALLGLGTYAGRIVHSARDRLLRDARKTCHVLNGYRFFNSGHRSIFLCQRCHRGHPNRQNERLQVYPTPPPPYAHHPKHTVHRQSCVPERLLSPKC